MKNLFLIFFCLFSIRVRAWSDPTEGKPFFPWAWEEQLRPTIINGFDKTGLILTGVGTASVFAVHQFDGKIYDFSKDGGNLLMSEDTAKDFGKLGNGVLALTIIGTQLAFDQNNGLKTARALLLATVAQLSIAATVRRDRPGNRTDYLPFPSSFPSGHTTSAFTMAGSLAYAYGPQAGIPAYMAASAIALARIKENRHWASDVVGGAFLGTFWARASFTVDDKDKEAFMILPIPVYDGGMISATRNF